MPGVESMLKAVLNYIRRLSPAIWMGAAVGATVFAFLKPGDDWILVYRPAVLAGFSDFPNVANPTYVLLILGPLAMLPAGFGAAFIVGSTFLSAWLAEKLTGASRWLIMLSYPAVWMIMYAQIDAWVMLGVALGYWAIRNNKPYAQGAAVVLLFIKPQVTLPLIIYYVWKQRSWKPFAVILAFLAASMLILGPWPVAWADKIIRVSLLSAGGTGVFSHAGNSIGLFPYGIVFLLSAALLPGYDLRRRSAALLAGTLLASPYAGYYSLLTAMALPLPLILYPLISLPLIALIGWWEITPIIVLIYYPFGLWLYRKRKRAAGPAVDLPRTD
jgi:hypothetical protein